MSFDRDAAPLGRFVDLLLDAIADRVVAKLGKAEPEFYDRNKLPPGAASWRAVLEAARRGDLQITRVGRCKVVRAEDWRTYLEARRSGPGAKRTPNAAPSHVDRLKAMGVVVPMRAGVGR